MIINEIVFKNKKMKIKFFYYFFFLLWITKQAGKALRNEKTKTTDEFLIEKEDPCLCHLK